MGRETNELLAMLMTSSWLQEVISAGSVEIRLLDRSSSTTKPEDYIYPGELALSCNPSYLGGYSRTVGWLKNEEATLCNLYPVTNLLIF